MNTTIPKKPAEKTAISDQEAMQHIRMIDSRMKGKNTTLIILITLLILSVGANVLQFLHLI